MHIFSNTNQQIYTHKHLKLAFLQQLLGKAKQSLQSPGRRWSCLLDLFDTDIGQSQEQCCCCLCLIEATNQERVWSYH